MGLRGGWGCQGRRTTSGKSCSSFPPYSATVRGENLCSSHLVPAERDSRQFLKLSARPSFVELDMCSRVARPLAKSSGRRKTVSKTCCSSSPFPSLSNGSSLGSPSSSLIAFTRNSFNHSGAGNKFQSKSNRARPVGESGFEPKKACCRGLPCQGSS